MLRLLLLVVCVHYYSSTPVQSVPVQSSDFDQKAVDEMSPDQLLSGMKHHDNGTFDPYSRDLNNFFRSTSIKKMLDENEKTFCNLVFPTMCEKELQKANCKQLIKSCAKSAVTCQATECEELITTTMMSTTEKTSSAQKVALTTWLSLCVMALTTTTMFIC